MRLHLYRGDTEVRTLEVDPDPPTAENIVEFEMPFKNELIAVSDSAVLIRTLAGEVKERFLFRGRSHDGGMFYVAPEER